MQRQINHKTMRRVVGAIALLLAPTVYVLSGTETYLTSISAAYWTESRDVFVGAMVAVAFFLFAYNGSGSSQDTEYYLSKTASLLAICVALFPTRCVACDLPPSWTIQATKLVGLTPHELHNVAAVLLFICLAMLMWLFSRRAKIKGKPSRARLYRIICALMLAGTLIIWLVGKHLDWIHTVLAVEAWGLTWFGIGWLIAGSYKSEFFGLDNFGT